MRSAARYSFITEELLSRNIIHRRDIFIVQACSSVTRTRRLKNIYIVHYLTDKYYYNWPTIAT